MKEDSKRIGELYRNVATYSVQLWGSNDVNVIRRILPGERVLLIKEDKKSVWVLSYDGLLGEILPGHFMEFEEVIL